MSFLSVVANPQIKSTQDSELSPTPDRENSSASWWQNLVRMFKEKKIECHIRNQNRKRTAGERNESCYCDIEKINEEATIMKKIERDEVSLGGWKSTRKKHFKIKGFIRC